MICFKWAEQKVALAAYATEYSIPQLTANQLDIVGKIVAALSPIEEITKAISANAASVSLIIPFVQCNPKQWRSIIMTKE